MATCINEFPILKVVDSGGVSYRAWTGWSVEDIRAKKPDWSIMKCIRFLQRFEDDIVESMVDAGWHTINEIMNEEVGE